MYKSTDLIVFKNNKKFKIIDKKIKRGSFGKPVKVLNEEIDQIFIIKKYEPFDEKNRAPFFETFITEIKLMYNIYHENIVRIFDYELDCPNYTGYIVMEFIEGCEFDKYFLNIDSTNGDNINYIFKQLIDGFLCLEQNKIIHRDIRSSNILITTENIVKIIDFGFGKPIKKTIDNKNTFNSIISRDDMKELPEEFEKGNYNSLTDMFCIAELFLNTIKKYNIGDFKYFKILEKMMKPKVEGRFRSFREIKNIIDKNNFNVILSNESNKKIYKTLINKLIEPIWYIEKNIILNKKHKEVINQLQLFIDNNLFENEIELNKQFFNIFIKSNYKFDYGYKILMKDIKNFYEWISSSDDEDQRIILQNINYKLRSVEEKLRNNPRLF